MKYVQLGNSELKVSQVCLGCMGYGDPQKGMHSWTLPLEPSLEILKMAIENGINFFDTAMGYQGGTSEKYLGEAIRRYAKRQDVIVATKFHGRTKEHLQQGISARAHITDCLNGSLQRLGLDYVDLYILHAWDYNTPIEETLEVLHELIASGKIRYIGISNCFAWQLAKANEIAKAHSWETFISVQGHYNLIFREDEREMAPYCQAHQITMTPYSALAAGRLSRLVNASTTKRLKEDSYAMGKYDASANADEKIINIVNQIAQQRNVSMTEVALAWLMHKGCVPIAGATKIEQLEGLIKACDLELTEEEITNLEALYVPHQLVGVMAANK